MFLLIRSLKGWIHAYLPTLRKLPKIVRRAIKIILLPYAVAFALAKLARNPLALSQIDFVVNTICTLRCKDCANLIQFYGKHKKAYNIPEHQLINSFYALMNVVDEIDHLQILGGEPFAHPRLYEVIQHMLNNKNVNRVSILTNGTLLPSSEVLTLLKSPKISISISDYKENSRKKDELIHVLQLNGTKVNLLEMKIWKCYGDLTRRNRTVKQLKRVFRKCFHPLCRSYLNGEFHLCPRSSHGIDLGKIPRKNDDYVNLLKLDCTTAKKEIKKLLYKTKVINACDYCDGSNEIPAVIVPPGAQIFDADI